MLKTNNNAMLEELLESDDELPLDYNENPATPAYQIESRFDIIQFKWINNASDESEKESVNFNVNKNWERPIICKGVLNKHDLFCLKAIERITSDSTFLWFINFLLHKDLHSNYNFLKSCLVNNISTVKQEPLTSVYKQLQNSPFESNELYRIIIKV